MTQLVYMVILDFIESNQEQFANFCGDESIAWANHNEFKQWLEQRDKSDAKILYELKAKNERLEKEADWLAERLKEACKNFNGCFSCPFYDDEGAYCIVEDKTWREAARKAVEDA